MLDLQNSESDVALALLSSAMSGGIEAEREVADLHAAAKVLSRNEERTPTSARHDMMRAIMIAPWSERSWKTAAFVQSCRSGKNES